jgi:hypothetical protein
MNRIETQILPATGLQQSSLDNAVRRQPDMGQRRLST